MKGNRTERLGDETVRRSLGGRGTADEEVHLRSTRAVTEGDSTSEGNKVTRGNVVLGNEGLLELHDFVETDVRVEGSLNVVEDHDRAVSTSAAAFQ